MLRPGNVAAIVIEDIAKWVGGVRQQQVRAVQRFISVHRSV